MDRGHEIQPRHVDSKSLVGHDLAYEKQFREFVDALLLPASAAHRAITRSCKRVIYGSPSRFSDPARFAFAHGGKDGHPFPVPLKIYDESIMMLRNAVNAAKLDNNEKLRGSKSSRNGRAIEETSTLCRRRQGNQARTSDFIYLWRYDVKGPSIPPRQIKSDGQQLSFLMGNDSNRDIFFGLETE